MWRFYKTLQNKKDDSNDSIILYDEKYIEDTLIINENVNNNNIHKYQRGNNKLQSLRIFKIKFRFLTLVITFFTVLFCLFFLFRSSNNKWNIFS